MSVAENAGSGIAAAKVAARSEMNHAFGHKPGGTKSIAFRRQRTISLSHAAYDVGAERATLAQFLNEIEETRKLKQPLRQTT